MSEEITEPVEDAANSSGGLLGEQVGGASWMQD